MGIFILTLQIVCEDFARTRVKALNPVSGIEEVFRRGLNTNAGGVTTKHLQQPAPCLPCIHSKFPFIKSPFGAVFTGTQFTCSRGTLSTGYFIISSFLLSLITKMEHLKLQIILGRLYSVSVRDRGLINNNP